MENKKKLTKADLAKVTGGSRYYGNGLLVANISAQLTGGKLGLAELTALPTLVMVTAN
ncbi:hypothetical protein [Ligilactobacillus ruminis]|uniref:hypothetical protein n=1 Tax=Ligilactobacillus ruminis TaxID=1623 RepID=UPI003BA90168